MEIVISLAPSAAGDTSFLPAYATPQAAGADLRAAVDDALVLKPGDRQLIPAGIKLALPPGFEAQVRSRSGLALRHGLYLPNAPGTIDSDYRGEVGVILQNGGTEAVTIQRGDRIAQMVVAPITTADFILIDRLPSTERGIGGFGSTGSA